MPDVSLARHAQFNDYSALFNPPGKTNAQCSAETIKAHSRVLVTISNYGDKGFLAKTAHSTTQIFRQIISLLLTILTFGTVRWGTEWQVTRREAVRVITTDLKQRIAEGIANLKSDSAFALKIEKEIVQKNITVDEQKKEYREKRSKELAAAVVKQIDVTKYANAWMQDLLTISQSKDRVNKGLCILGEKSLVQRIIAKEHVVIAQTLADQLAEKGTKQEERRAIAENRKNFKTSTSKFFEMKAAASFPIDAKTKLKAKAEQFKEYSKLIDLSGIKDDKNRVERIKARSRVLVTISNYGDKGVLAKIAHSITQIFRQVISVLLTILTLGTFRWGTEWQVTKREVSKVVKADLQEWIAKGIVELHADSAFTKQIRSEFASDKALIDLDAKQKQYKAQLDECQKKKDECQNKKYVCKSKRKKSQAKEARYQAAKAEYKAKEAEYNSKKAEYRAAQAEYETRDKELRLKRAKELAGAIVQHINVAKYADGWMRDLLKINQAKSRVGQGLHGSDRRSLVKLITLKEFATIGQTLADEIAEKGATKEERQAIAKKEDNFKTADTAPFHDVHEALRFKSEYCEKQTEKVRIENKLELAKRDFDTADEAYNKAREIHNDYQALPFKDRDPKTLQELDQASDDAWNKRIRARDERTSIQNEKTQLENEIKQIRNFSLVLDQVRV